MPKRIGLKVLSLDVNEKNIKAIYGKQTKTGLKVLDSFIVETPANSVIDGRINKIDELESAIAKALEVRKIKSGLFSFCFKSSSYQEREIVLPKVSKKELPAMVNYEIQQYLPYDVSKYAVEYSINEEFYKNGQEFYSLNVSAIEKSVVKPYLNLIKRLGFKPHKFDVYSNSLNKLINISRKEFNNNIEEKQIAFIDFGFNSSSISIFNDGKQKMSLSIEFGIDVLVRMMDEQGVIGNKPWRKSFLNTSDFKYVDESTALTLFDDYELSRAINTGLNEVLGVFRYYMSRDEFNKIDEVYIHGSLSHLIGIEDKIEKALLLPIKKVKDLSFPQDLLSLDFEDYFHVIGSLLVVDGVEEYNFFKAFKKTSSTSIFYVLAIVFLASAILSTHTYFDHKINELKDRDEYLETQVATLIGNGYLKATEELNIEKTDLENLASKILVYGYTDAKFDVVKYEFFATVIEAMPEQIYFESWSKNYRKSIINGITYDFSSVAEFEKNLREVGFEFTHIEHVTVDPDDSDKYHFEIHFNEVEVSEDE